MNREDKEVIRMVNAPHEERARRKRRQMQYAKLQQLAIRAILKLAIKVELCTIAIGLLIIAVGNGWLADWLGRLAIAICIAAGSVQIGRYIEG